MGARGQPFASLGISAGVVAGALFTVFPVLWMVLTSVKPFGELFAVPARLWPGKFTLDHYRQLFRLTNFPLYFENSTIVAVATTILSLFLATLASYGLTRFPFRGSELFGKLVLFTYMFPPVLLSIPLFVFMTTLKLTNSYAGLVAAHLSFALPFCIWLLRTFFRAVPAEVEEAALIDGASRPQALLRIVIPMAYPGIIAAGIFTFVLSWNDYLFALLLMVSETKKTLPVGVALFVQGATVEWGLIMAGATLITLPVAILITLVQRYLIAGLGAGAVKG